MALKRHSFLLAIALALAPVTVTAGPVSLFPDPDILLDQADQEYEDFFTHTEWKLKAVEIDGSMRQARYQSSVLLFPPAVTRTGFYSWTVLYRVKDRYRAAGQSLYACRTAAISVRHRLSKGEWRWFKDVRLDNAFDRTEDPCGANDTRSLHPSAVADMIPEAIKALLP